MARALCTSMIEVSKAMMNEPSARELITRLRGKYLTCWHCGGKRTQLVKCFYSQCTRCGHMHPWHYDTVLPFPGSAALFLFCIYTEAMQPKHRDAMYAIRQARKGMAKVSVYKRGRQLSGYRRSIVWAQETWTLADLPIDQGHIGFEFGAIKFT